MGVPSRFGVQKPIGPLKVVKRGFRSRSEHQGGNKDKDQDKDREID